VPAWSDERIHIYLATDLQASQQNLEKDELLETYEVQWTDALDMIHRGEIQDAKTICAFFLAVGPSMTAI
jgi:ADP-ribose pyrophosphatase